MKNTVKIAFCGIMAALSTAVLFLAGVIPTLTVALPAVAGCLLIPVGAELGRGWGLGVFAVCSLLSLLLVNDREAALIYLLFFGYYPLVMPLFDRLRPAALGWAAKLALFNAMAVAEYFLSIFVLGIPADDMGFLGKLGPWLLLALANVVFVLYDRALRGLVVVYLKRFQPVVRRTLNMR